MKKIAKFGLFVFCLVGVGLGGCVSVKERVSPNPEVYWQPPKPTDSTVEVLSKWQGGALDLVALIDLALANNPGTRVAWFQAKAAAAEWGQAKSAYYPTVSASVNFTRSKMRSVDTTHSGIPFLADSTYTTSYGPSLQINYLLFDFGKRSSDVKAALQALYMANFTYNQSLQDLVFNVEMNYYQLYGAEAMVAASLITLEEASTTYRVAEEKRRTGLGSEVDRLRALASLKSAEFEREKNLALVENNRAVLANGLGISVSEAVSIIHPGELLACKELEREVDELMEVTLREKPSLQAARAALRSLTHQRNSAKRNFFPTVSGTVLGDYFHYQRARGNPYQNYQAALVLNWNLFEGFNRQYQLIEAKALEREARQLLRGEQLQAVSQVWSAYFSFKAAQKQVVSAKAMVAAAEAAHKAMQISYERGLSDIADLLKEHSVLALARQQKVDAEVSLATSMATLAYATGHLSYSVTE